MKTRCLLQRVSSRFIVLSVLSHTTVCLPDLRSFNCLRRLLDDMLTFILMPTFAISASLVGGEYTFLSFHVHIFHAGFPTESHFIGMPIPFCCALTNISWPYFLPCLAFIRTLRFNALLVPSDCRLPTADILIPSCPRCICRAPCNLPA